jgi:3-oxoacyl-[acyl-carrier protein] reductase
LFVSVDASFNERLRFIDTAIEIAVAPFVALAVCVVPRECAAMNLEEMRIVVTGAASGIGREFCLSLARAGARVAAFDVDRNGLGRLIDDARSAGGFAEPYVVNVTDEGEVVAAVQRAARDLGFLNGLVNNAGIYRDGLLAKRVQDSGPTLKLPLQQWQAVVDVDLTGPFLLTREVVAHMIDAKVRPGVIVNISSVSRAGNAGQSSYSAAKAGTVAQTVVWASELSPYGIRAVAIAPGFVRTPILSAMQPAVLEGWVQRVPLGRLGEPSEIFQGLRFAIECDFFNGRCLEIDGGLRM